MPVLSACHRRSPAWVDEESATGSCLGDSVREVVLRREGLLGPLVRNEFHPQEQTNPAHIADPGQVQKFIEGATKFVGRRSFFLRVRDLHQLT
jgi:hypothetical protein